MDINHNEENSTEEFTQLGAGFSWGDTEVTDEMEELFSVFNKL